MARRVRADRLRRALHRVLRRAGAVRTLTRLTRLVNDELQRRDDEANVTPARLRRAAVLDPDVRTLIHTRRGTSQALGKRCPVCGGALRRVENRTLTGQRVTVEARCTRCVYWTGRHKRIPVRYTFQNRER